MSTPTVGFAIADDLRPDLEEVVAEYGHGNRSEFLRVAVREFKGRLRAERMQALREEGRSESGGRIYTADEVREMVAAELKLSAAE